MNKLTIQEIKKLLKTLEDEPDDERISHWREDERKGVQKALKSYDRRLEKRNVLKKQLDTMQHYEQELRSKGYQRIAGLDEVGRGPLAGPVVVAAVVLPEDNSPLLGVQDSKTLSAKERSRLAERIYDHALSYAIVEVSPSDIDRLNIYQATRLGMVQACQKLSLAADYLLVDAMEVSLDIPQEAIIQGDQHSLSIASASIIAKVYRDQLMMAYHKLYPEFGFDTNMGYGTAQHIQALERYGYTPIHRQSFAPVSHIHTSY